ncbi:hypothetical protein L208DRAFT_1242974, partial [Tricholoma matsutake]
IIANHACSPDSDQLKMNIAGMVGTGKTEVLKALVDFWLRMTQPMLYKLWMSAVQSDFPVLGLFWACSVLQGLHHQSPSQ